MNKYPMTYEEFKKKSIAHARKYLGYSKVVDEYLAGAEAEMIIRGKYKHNCVCYDGKGDYYPESQNFAFTEGAIASCGYELNMCCDY